MPILLSDGENLYISAYDFKTVIQPINTNPMADEQEIFLTVKNPPDHEACVFKGATPRRTKPSVAKMPIIQRGATPRRIKPGKKKAC